MMCENVVQGDIPLPLLYYYYYYFDLHTMCVWMVWSGLVWCQNIAFTIIITILFAVCVLFAQIAQPYTENDATLEGVCSVAHKTCEMLCTGFMIRQIQKEDTKEKNVFLFNCCHGYTLTYYSYYYYWQHVLHPHFNLITLTLNYHQHTMRRRRRRSKRMHE